MTALLSVRNLTTTFDTAAGRVKAVDSVDLDLHEGETLGIVGESGCGKSVTALSIMRLVPQPPGRIAEGKVELRGTDLRALSEPEMRSVRGNEIAMIFQEPMTSLNPVFTVGSQIVEAIRLHRRLSKRDAAAEAVRLLERVDIPDAARRFNDYPHQLSGGMRQRVMIAMALSCEPSVLIADEPTTALDVTIQAQILELLAGLSSSAGMAVLLITHDLGVVAEYADRMLVMYAGRVVENGRVADVLERPMHPYTQGLLASQPGFAAPGELLKTVPGIVPPLWRLPSGCRFHDRCPFVEEDCRRLDPRLVTVGPSHEAACPVLARNAPGMPS